MADNTHHTIINGPAVPLSITVGPDAGHWVIRAWYHGKTMHEALNPQLVAERYIDHTRVPLDATWRQLWMEVAIAVNDLAELAGGIVRTD